MTDVTADAYATMADFRLFVRNAATTDATDADTTFELLALEAAARAIEASCGYRTFAVAGTASDRYFTPRYEPALTRSRVIVPIDDTFDDAADIDLYFDSTGNGDWGDAVTTFRVGPLNAAEKGQPYTRLILDIGTSCTVGKDRAKVTAAWGWDTIPNTIRNANLIQAARFLKRRDAAFGVAGSPEMGNELRLLARVDPDVAVMLTPFRRYV